MRLNMHPEDVKAAVRKTGISLAELGRRNGFSASAARKCLYEPVPVANRAVAARLEKSVHELWPQWYDADGERILRFTREPITPPESRDSQKRSAA